MATVEAIEVRGARVHNLRDVDVDVPLGKLVAVAGVSGSGKSSLALGVLYAEGSRRYLEALSTYTRRRLTQSARAEVDEIRHLPAALALHQRPGVPGIRSTFGTGTELLNSLRLLFSRCATHRCPNGHDVPPSLAVAAEKPLVCPVCGAEVRAPGAEDLAFNSRGACPRCQGAGDVWEVNRAALVPDESLTIDQGAVAPWGSLMWSLMTDVCRAMGVRTDVPFRDLTPAEKAIVYDGPAEKKHILYRAKKGDDFAELDFTYYSAVRTVENALAKVKDEQGMKRVARFLTRRPCPDCGGTRLSAAARAPRVAGIGLDAACQMPLADLAAWVAAVPATLPPPMRPMAQNICDAFAATARRLLDLGLGYLALDRAAATLSTGERQRMQLARAVRNRSTGVLYVLDEPSIGLHPANLVGLSAILRELVADGNTVLLVDHDPTLLRQADWLIELGPGAGRDGGRLVAQGPIPQIAADPASRIGPFLRPGRAPRIRPETPPADLFAHGALTLRTGPIHTVKPLEARFPKGRLTAVTGPSGSGKTTLVLESLLPAMSARREGRPLPAHVLALDAPGLSRATLIDATPIGINVRSTLATYAGIHDELRRRFAKTPEAKARRLKAGDFSYNTGSLRCPTCDGTGEISLDIQFLPDVSIPCPDCHGTRYAPAADAIPLGAHTLPGLMALDVRAALDACAGIPPVRNRLRTLADLGLGYLTLGEQTPALSGGEAQRLKLAEELGRAQDGALFVFDEPTIGLHPLDVQTLLNVFQRLLDRGATLIVIEHDLDLIRNADWVLDLGPGGGAQGGRIVAQGTPAQLAQNPASPTGRFL